MKVLGPGKPPVWRYVLVLMLEVIPVLLVLTVAAALAFPRYASYHRSLHNSSKDDNPYIRKLHARHFGTDPAEIVGAATYLAGVDNYTVSQSALRAARRLVLEDLLGDKLTSAGTLRDMGKREEFSEWNSDFAKLYDRLGPLLAGHVSPQDTGPAADWRPNPDETYRHAGHAVWAGNRTGSVRVEMTNGSKRDILDIDLRYPLPRGGLTLGCRTAERSPDDPDFRKPWLAGQTIRLMCRPSAPVDPAYLMQAVQGLGRTDLVPSVGRLKLKEPPVSLSSEWISFPDEWKRKGNPRLDYGSGWVPRLDEFARDAVNRVAHAEPKFNPHLYVSLIGVILGLATCALVRHIWNRARSFRIAGLCLSLLAIVPFLAPVYYAFSSSGPYALFGAIIVAGLSGAGYVGWLVGFWLDAIALGPRKPNPYLQPET